MKKIFIFFLILQVNFLKSQFIDSIVVLNGSFITTIDTVRIKVFTTSGEGGTIQSSSYSVNGSTITGTLHMCSGGLATVFHSSTVIKINPLNAGTFNAKIKLMDYDTFFSPSCNVLKASVSDSLNINVQLFNDVKENNSWFNNITLHPNPFNNQVQIVNNNYEESFKIGIFDVFGKNVYTGINNKDKLNMDLSFLKSGIYYLRAYNNSQQKTFKIIKD